MARSLALTAGRCIHRTECFKQRDNNGSADMGEVGGSAAVLGSDLSHQVSLLVTILAYTRIFGIHPYDGHLKVFLNSSPVVDSSQSACPREASKLPTTRDLDMPTVNRRPGPCGHQALTKRRRPAAWPLRGMVLMEKSCMTSYAENLGSMVEEYALVIQDVYQQQQGSEGWVDGREYGGFRLTPFEKLLNQRAWKKTGGTRPILRLLIWPSASSCPKLCSKWCCGRCRNWNAQGLLSLGPNITGSGSFLHTSIRLTQNGYKGYGSPRWPFQGMYLKAYRDPVYSSIESYWAHGVLFFLSSPLGALVSRAAPQPTARACAKPWARNYVVWFWFLGNSSKMMSQTSQHGKAEDAEN